MAQFSLKPTQKGLTLLAVVTVVIFIGCLLACLGAVAKVGEVNGERAKVEKQLKQNQIVAQTEQASENKYEDTKAQIRYLESSVSTQAYIPTLLKQIERLGKSVNLKVIGVRPKAPDNIVKKTSADSAPASGDASAAAAAAKPAPKPYDEVNIELTVEGSYMSALDFLYRLTSFPKIIAVNTVQMDPVASVNKQIGSPQLTITMQVTAFVFKESKDKDSPKKPAGTAMKPGRIGNEAG